MRELGSREEENSFASIIIIIAVVLSLFTLFNLFNTPNVEVNPSSSWYTGVNDDCIHNEDMEPIKDQPPQRFLEELTRYD